jgi:cell division protein ZapA (FtsZ GTPase activity inhibitor)
MGEPRRVELTLLGQALTVRTEAPPEYVRTLARYLEKRVEALRKSGVQDPSKALLLAALDITDELFRAREDREREAGDVGARLGALVALLERATPKEGGRSSGQAS